MPTFLHVSTHTSPCFHLLPQLLSQCRGSLLLEWRIMAQDITTELSLVMCSCPWWTILDTGPHSSKSIAHRKSFADHFNNLINLFFVLLRSTQLYPCQDFMLWAAPMMWNLRWAWSSSPPTAQGPWFLRNAFVPSAETDPLVTIFN